MSASLVGSEMCIRDSPRTPLSLEPAVPRRAVSQSVLEQHAPQRGECEAPVSYTHLTLPTICSV
eukprot:6642349-Alexandrium_andersonii.AAC.1